MNEEDLERRLTTILAADVVGYSRLMGKDDAGTLAALKTHRRELIVPKAAQYGGRTVKLMGDGTLMEFGSVVDAVHFAVEVQCAMRTRNASLPEDRRILYRIGINVGDIIVEGEDIYGDGVNVAARLEGLAEPGGICVRRNVRNEVRDKLALDFEDLGEVEVKNIARPIRAYQAILNKKAESLVTDYDPHPKGRRFSPAALAAGIALLLVVAGVAWWRPWEAPPDSAVVVARALPLPDQPSIAVLPFYNMSNDPAQDYFADGMAEDLITDLSKISGLFVIARNSSFAYKGKSPDIRRVGRELGVRYVLEGSVRRVGERVRINAQLIDTVSGGHRWAERYDGSMSDVFALQDQVTEDIIRALAVRLSPDDKARQTQGSSENPKAHDSFLRGWAHYVRSSAADYAAAIPYFKEALRLDPEYGRAQAVLASIYQVARIRGWQAHLGLTPDDTLERAVAHLAEAMKRPTPLAHQVASSFLTRNGQHDKAIAEAENALALDGNDPAGYFAMARALTFAGQSEKAAGFIDKAKRLNPYYPSDYDFYGGVVEFGQAQYEKAVPSLENAQKLARDNPGILLFLIASYGHLGRTLEAEPAMEKLRALASTRSMEWIFSATVLDANLWRYKRKEDSERLRRGLRLAGLPEFTAEWDLRDVRKLTGEEVRALAFGRTMQGHHPVSGLEFVIRRDAEGGFSSEGLWNDSGVSRIEDDRLCNIWSRFQPSCGVIYINPAEAAETGDKYLLVKRSGAYPFSILE